VRILLFKWVLCIFLNSCVFFYSIFLSFTKIWAQIFSVCILLRNLRRSTHSSHELMWLASFYLTNWCLCLVRGSWDNIILTALFLLFSSHTLISRTDASVYECARLLHLSQHTLISRTEAVLFSFNARISRTNASVYECRWLLHSLTSRTDASVSPTDIVVFIPHTHLTNWRECVWVRMASALTQLTIRNLCLTNWYCCSHPTHSSHELMWVCMSADGSCTRRSTNSSHEL